MRNNFHLKFKEYKDRKKYSLKSIEGYFSKVQNSLPPAGAMQKKLVSNENFKEEKKIAEEQKQKEMEEKKPKKECRRKTATKSKEL